MNNDILLTLVESVETLTYELHEEYRILSDKCKKLEKRIALLESKYNNVCNTNNVKYLAIGNSITVHSVCDYWWSTCGMAASDMEHDYVHVLAKKRLF